MKHFKIILIPVIFIFAMGIPQMSLAGGAQGPGIVKYQAPTSKDSFLQFLAKRHETGIEYALDEDSEFTKLLEVFALDIAASSAIGTAGLTTEQLKQANDIKAVIFALVKEESRISSAYKKGIDFEFVNKSIRTLLELAVKKAESSGLAPPSTSLAVAVAKLATAYATAYTYGFFWGR